MIFFVPFDNTPSALNSGCFGFIRFIDFFMHLDIPRCLLISMHLKNPKRPIL